MGTGQLAYAVRFIPAVLFVWASFPERLVGGGGRCATFALLIFVVVVVGKVEGPPHKDQDQGEDGPNRKRD